MYAGFGELTLLARVSGLLTSGGIDHCLIGAAAMSVHGVVRATADLDLLILDPRPLQTDFWADTTDDISADIRLPGAEDPLGGVVRVADAHSGCIDVVVGRPAWHADVIARAVTTEVLGVDLPVALPRDLVALKLYAGGPQDAWDIQQLLDVDPNLATEVDALIDRLPADARELWARVRSERS